MSNNGAIIRATGVVKTYGKGHTEVKVLKGVDFEVREGEFVAIVGASGSGKSTLLHLLGGLDVPDEGDILYSGQSFAKMESARRDAVRNEAFGFVFQFYHLLPEFTALENVMMPAMIRYGIFRWAAEHGAARRRAVELLEKFGLAERLSHRPSQLSGGEQQRVAIARALMGRPRLLLCDEPTGNLDAKTGGGIMDALLELNRNGQTMVVVTHDRGLAALAHRITTLVDGRLGSDRANKGAGNGS